MHCLSIRKQRGVDEHQVITVGGSLLCCPPALWASCRQWPESRAKGLQTRGAHELAKARGELGCCPVAIKSGVRNPELGPTARRLAELGAWVQEQGLTAPLVPSDLLGPPQGRCCPPCRPRRAGEGAYRGGGGLHRWASRVTGAVEANAGLSRCSGAGPLPPAEAEGWHAQGPGLAGAGAVSGWVVPC